MATRDYPADVSAKPKAKKVNILTDAKIICEPGGYLYYGCRTEEERAKEMESWCRDFNKFVRDHRHQDGTSVNVERTFTDSCSTCKAQWEPMDDNGVMCCAACGTEIDNG